MRIAITGTPGVGKTAVAVALGNILGLEVVSLGELAKTYNLYEGFDRKRQCPIVHLGRLRDKVDGMEEVIVESHYAHDMPVDRIVVLRCEIGELRKRLEAKGWAKAKIDENIQAEMMDVCAEEAKGIGLPLLEVDTTKKTPVQAAQEVAVWLMMKG